MGERACDLFEPQKQMEGVLRVGDVDYSGRNIAIVKGPASGIGRAVAIALAVDGLWIPATPH